MGIKLKELQVGSPIVITVSAKEKSLKIDGVVNKIVKDNAAVISLNLGTKQKLNFDNVNIDVEYYVAESAPVKWKNAKIIYYQGSYILQVPGEGSMVNRRGCFRVGVSKTAQMKMKGDGFKDVLIKDVSFSGFAIADTSKSLNLQKGAELSVYLDDMGYILNLSGQVVRVQEEENVTIYGLEITNLCKDLSPYISRKQVITRK